MKNYKDTANFWFEKIRGSSSEFSAEHRIFNMSIFFSLLSSLTVFVSLFIDIHITNIVLTTLSFIVYGWIYYKSRILKKYTSLKLPFILWSQFMLNLFWFTNEGSEGAILPVIIAVLPLYITLTPDKKHFLVILLAFLNLIVLYAIEYYYPELLIAYPSRESRYIVIGLTLSIMVAFIGIYSHLQKKNYEEEKRINVVNRNLVDMVKNDLRIKKIIENSLDAVVTTTNDGIILEWNYAAVKMFGYEVSEALGKTLNHLIIPETLQYSFDKAINYFKEKTNYIRFETGGIKKNTEIFPIELSMSQIEYDDMIMLNFFIRDITERNENDKKILKKNEQLQQLNEEMDTFIYRASHDLRAPLTNVQGLIEFFPIALQDSSHEELMDKMKQNVDKLLHVLEDLSNYSKNHRLELQMQPINIKNKVNDILGLLKNHENLPDVIINTFESGDYNFISDEERIHIILFNLIENAVTFTNAEENDPEINIYVEKCLDKTILRVKDNGEGIKPEIYPKIFDMFFRGSIKSKGAGLGLYIVKRVVNKLKGKIEVQSTKGMGTEFILELPNHIETDPLLKAKNVF